MLLPSGNPFECHEEILHFCSLPSHLNVLTFFPLTGGCSEGLDAFRFYLNNNFQVNNGVLYFLDYVEDIIMVLFVLVSTLIPNRMYLPLIL